MNRAKMSGIAGSEDKYEQILHKYDWHASRPPRGYVYGIGRGAKAFITTAELTVSTSNSAPHISAEEDKFFAMLDAIEQRKSKPNDREVVKAYEDNSNAHGAVTENTSRKLSWDELSSIESATIGTTQVQASSVNNLIPRNARDERVEAAEEYAFSDETHVITAQDVLRGKATSSQTNLQRILTMGSSAEQSTWITHSRAYREMGMAKKALSTLMEGCAQTGSQGSLIWKERLRYIDANNELARRRVLEQATASCPSAEELWLELLRYALPHEELGILQKAVIACPSSELLWVRVLEHVPSVNDQRKLIKRALEHNRLLPRLWARLARLETLERGKAIFREASRKYSSFELSIEAITFIEWSLLHDWDASKNEVEHQNIVNNNSDEYNLSIKGEEDDNVNIRNSEQNKKEYTYNTTNNNSDKWVRLFNVLQKLHKELDQLVRQASQTYLIVNDTSSRMRWLQTAFRVATEEKCVWTCGFMLAYMILPTNAIISTQIDAHLLFDDLIQLLRLHNNMNNSNSDTAYESGNEPQQKRINSHEELCALWAAWIICILTLRNDSATRHGNIGEDNSERSARNDNVDNAITDILCGNNNYNSSSSSSINTSNANMIVDIIYHCVASAPSSAMAQISSFLLSSSFSEEEEKLKQYKDESSNVVVKNEEEEKERNLASSSAISTINVKENEKMQNGSLEKNSRRKNSNDDNDTIKEKQNNTMSLETLSSVLVYTLEHALLSRNIILRIVISNAFVAREELYLCLHILRRQYRVRMNTINNNNNDNNNKDIKTSLGLQNTHDRILIAIAEARVYAAMHLNESADATLQSASALAIESVNTNVNTATITTINSNSNCIEKNMCNDIAWYMLALHRRSLQVDTCDVLKTACAHFPHSTRLWLMRLEAMCHSHCTSMKKEVIVKQEDEYNDDNEVSLPPTSNIIINSSSTSPLLPNLTPNFTTEQVREVRLMCQEALSESHCKYSVEVWIYVALHVEASLLRNFAAARALLLDATLVCCPTMSSSSLPSLRVMESYVQLGIARVKLERIFGGTGNNGVALDIVREVLQKIPKTRQGLFRVDVSELLQMQIELEPPATRGRVAATVMKMYKPHDALVFMAIAQLYHAAGHFHKAMEEAIKAVRARRHWNEVHSPILYHLYSDSSYNYNNIDSKTLTNNTIEAKCANEERLLLMPFALRSSLTELLSESHNNTNSRSTVTSNDVICGDAVALLWKLALLPQYKSIIGIRTEFGYTTAELENMSQLPEAKVQSWVMSIAFATDNINNYNNNGGKTKISDAQSISGNVSKILMYGPLWSRVSQEDDPSNITLLNFRESAEVMLHKVMKLITL